MEHADLREAHLEKADLREAHLENTTLWGAHLEHANLGKAQLNNTFLVKTDLTQTKNLTQEQVDQAFGNKATQLATQLPKGLQHPQDWGEYKSFEEALRSLAQNKSRIITLSSSPFNLLRSQCLSCLYSMLGNPSIPVLSFSLPRWLRGKSKQKNKVIDRNFIRADIIDSLIMSKRFYINNEQTEYHYLFRCLSSNCRHLLVHGLSKFPYCS